jgi:hypothetical protein
VGSYLWRQPTSATKTGSIHSAPYIWHLLQLWPPTNSADAISVFWFTVISYISVSDCSGHTALKRCRLDECVYSTPPATCLAQHYDSFSSLLSVTSTMAANAIVTTHKRDWLGQHNEDRLVSHPQLVPVCGMCACDGPFFDLGSYCTNSK